MFYQVRVRAKVILVYSVEADSPREAEDAGTEQADTSVTPDEIETLETNGANATKESVQ